MSKIFKDNNVSDEQVNDHIWKKKSIGANWNSDTIIIPIRNLEINQEKINLSVPQDLSLIFNKSLDEIEKSQSKLIEHVNDFFSPINYYEVQKKLKI